MFFLFSPDFWKGFVSGGCAGIVFIFLVCFIALGWLITHAPEQGSGR